ncbi:MAG: Sel1 repeat-containing protein [Candidatus Electronema aureum]|uniref:Sel1 repeat-containing protein n=1 Tax=Candidatus Electronema aureum TaxID=2005002 RepID=A0A521G1R8_9BACT|nr:MAG: Sel1 repeat-containing protein [Candidatus Electronema aureum]
MSFFDFLKKLADSDRHDRRKQLEAASFRHEGEEAESCAALDSIRIKDEPLSALAPEFNLSSQPEAETALPEMNPQHQRAVEHRLVAESSTPYPLPGGIYAMQERNGGLYRIVKVVHAEDGFVHVLRYAGRFLQVPERLSEQELTLEVDAIDGSFGAEHLPIPAQSFAANSIFIQDRPLTDSDFRGWQLYVDSVYDCLSDNSPAWLRKVGSYAAWRDDPNAMAVLADRYLLGVDLPRDSKKSRYWLNRIVQRGISIIQLGEQVREEYQILTGGVYSYAEEDGSWVVCKAVLKDRHGVQLLICPTHFEHMPKKTNPARLLAHAAQSGQECVHASLTADDFLNRPALFMGLLPITLEELHCYRKHLRALCSETTFQPSTFEVLLQRAEANEAEAQLEVAQMYLTGDPEWEIEQSIPEAVRWLTEAANLGHGPAAYALSMICRDGAGDAVAQDAPLSFEWLLYAAQLNYGLAQLEAAECCLQGQGCPQDAALAHAWLSVAVSHDNGLSEEQKQRAKTQRQDIDAALPAAQKAKARDYFRHLQDSF